MIRLEEEGKLAVEFTVSLLDRPGVLADLTETLSKGGVTIMALHASPCAGEGIVQFVTTNPDATVNVLKNAGIDYASEQVLLLTLSSEPAILVRLARALAEAEININALYSTMSANQIVLDADNLAGAQRVALSLGVM